ncbi:hypothetical protein LCGC14_2076240 [marine sediment metagenome]|uniref:Uncharacterized protein n=1 Tax=marine sediment metagenome TaxID=412755 RepID=A0A0F9EH72_9ZZZZ
MTMIYTEDWARENTFSKPECIREYAKHGLSADDLIADLGDHAEYTGADVLDAIGY